MSECTFTPRSSVRSPCTKRLFQKVLPPASQEHERGPLGWEHGVLQPFSRFLCIAAGPHAHSDLACLCSVDDSLKRQYVHSAMRRDLLQGNGASFSGTPSSPLAPSAPTRTSLNLLLSCARTPQHPAIATAPVRAVGLWRMIAHTPP
mmetsp:Transcript_27088/g.59500  ORF Transcript_27088/g.59500 Transcript_27088/m.59500 type:complete len:147 (+) Transcript_27088:343-783(+)